MRDVVLTRRAFLRYGGLGLGSLALAACGGQQQAAEPTDVPPTEPPATAVPTAETATEQVIVGDVLEYELDGDWTGQYGWVTFRLHDAFVAGETVYFIRTDASDEDFATENELVYVPLLSAGERAPETTANLYVFEDGAADQLPVMSTKPGDAEFSPLWRLHRVTAGDDTVYDSAEALLEAAEAGDVTIEEQDIFVNYPVVKWPGGELAVDEAKEETLGDGQLIEPVNTDDMTVTFKLHQCFPGSRYILTDTSSEPMAPMMSIPASEPTQALAEAGGTDKIWVFANGIEGSGVMGFQPAIFGNKAGDPAWSPFWNHFTLRWTEEATPRVLTSAAEIREALEAGEVEEFNGTPNTHPDGFVVNCPAPILAPNTFTG